MKSIIDVNQTIRDMAAGIRDLDLENPLVVGIHTGGVWVANRLHEHLGLAESPATLDISFYRDDFSRVGLNPEVKSSELPMDIDERNIILVDDVLYTGRTIRAAMNEILSYGRPSMIRLCVLAERSGRELPVQADIVGCSLDLAEYEQARLSCRKDKLTLTIVTTGTDE